MSRALSWIAAAVVLGCGQFAAAQKIAVPRAQDRPPGPALSPEEAVRRMTLPEGFHVEVVAAEPDVVNPVAMFIDEKGRYWITESFEYPRREPGPGRDRVKVLEDTDGDGKVDKTTVFAEGLNIPSGIAVGYGGVWVANAPDLLFLQDTDGDLKADKTTTVVSGFGRTDTHELPNSLTWGPDGWLYGLNGVFNYSDVKYAEGNPNFRKDHPGWKFTCALWRVHPKTREFQIWAEGTSNPWGIAVNDEGDFFLSACVIDHLWHIAETGYYIRQGGPYPPHTWPIGSIVRHKHQKAAYCGITWFDSDNYPEPYRKILYMGNIHGGCINADVVSRNGSTYAGKPHPGFSPKSGAFDLPDNTIAKTGDEKSPKLADLLTANDSWFMPVAQKTGPDGCLYVLDWYDRYHCYQDANADPEGIDRGKGRLYRLVYGDSKPAKARDFTAIPAKELAEMALRGHNEYERETARRVLSERLSAKSSGDDAAAIAMFRESLADSKTPMVERLRALWTLASSDGVLKTGDLDLGVNDFDTVVAWSIRLLGDRRHEFEKPWGDLLAGFAVGGPRATSNPQVLLQLAVAFSKWDDEKQTDLPKLKAAFLLTLLEQAPDDPILAQIVWQNLHPLLNDDAAIDALLDIARDERSVGTAKLLSRAVNRIQSREKFDAAQIADMVESLSSSKSGAAREAAAATIASIAANSQTGSLDASRQAALQKALAPMMTKILGEGLKNPHYLHAAQLSCSWKQPAGIEAVKQLLEASKSDGLTLDCLRALIASGDPSAIEWSERLLDAGQAPLQEQVLFYLSRLDLPRVGEMVLVRYSKLEPQVQPKAIELLTQRAVWTGPLLVAVEKKEVNKESLNLNQLRRVSSFKDEAVQKQFKALYGVLREGRNPNREQVINQTRDFLYGTPGDPQRGHAVFKKVCAQCHKIYGEGAEVGPDLTSNGRASFDQLLSNILDPSLVIGNGYQARILITQDGRVLTGLPVEDSSERVILKVQGGKTETIPRDQIEEYKVSEVSMMPEQLEKQLTPQELADLFSFIGLDKPPTDPAAKRLPGVPTGRK